jgi:capsular exopolysaccharide synthesis family protein
MGRVDDAMRRAAGRQPETGTPAEPDAASLSAEPFPREPAWPADPGTPGPAADPPIADLLGDASLRPPADAAPEAAAPDEPAGDSAPRPGSTMFQRVDPRFAGKIVVDHSMKPSFREQYRRLAATLHQAQIERGIKVIMVVSAVAGEGKTLTASNLALTLSESYHRQVLLVDGDLRRPSLHTVLGVTAQTGLSEGLFAAEQPKLTLHQISTRLALLPAGRPISDPMAGLTSDRMGRILTEARAAFEWVIVDTPPVGLLPDGHLLAAMGDGALLVVRAAGPAYGQVQRAIEAVGRDRILGVVLNKAEEFTADGYYYRYDYRPHSTPPSP